MQCCIPGDEKETVEIIELDSLWLDVRWAWLLEYFACTYGDGPIRQAVVVQQLSACGFEGREVVVGCAITWAQSFNILNDGVIEAFPGPGGVVVQELTRVVDS